MNTVLDKYTIWFDGTITVPSNQIDQYMHVDKLAVDEMTPQLQQYNRLMQKSKQLTVKTDCDGLIVDWNIPANYKEENIKQVILDKHHALCQQFNWSDEEYLDRISRILVEYSLYSARKYIPLLRVMHYLVDTLIQQNIVWGPGRGSGVSSYILYVLQVHDVDSVAFDLDINDFL